MPGVVEKLEQQIRDWLDGAQNPFDTAVKGQAGNGTYYTEHADPMGDELSRRVHDVVGDLVGARMLEEHFSALFDQPVHLGNMCCGTCITHDGTLSSVQLLHIQRAAVNTRPDGSLFTHVE